MKIATPAAVMLVEKSAVKGSKVVGNPGQPVVGLARGGPKNVARRLSTRTETLPPEICTDWIISGGAIPTATLSETITRLKFVTQRNPNTTFCFRAGRVSADQFDSIGRQGIVPTRCSARHANRGRRKRSARAVGRVGDAQAARNCTVTRPPRRCSCREREGLALRPMLRHRTATQGRAKHPYHRVADRKHSVMFGAGDSVQRRKRAQLTRSIVGSSKREVVPEGMPVARRKVMVATLPDWNTTVVLSTSVTSTSTMPVTVTWSNVMPECGT
jgi:hypothetical protein